MNIEMKPGTRPNAKPDDGSVWWWQVLDDGERVKGGVGWGWGKLTAYESAMKFLREEQQRRGAA